jgi:hypothetical protein
VAALAAIGGRAGTSSVADVTSSLGSFSLYSNTVLFLLAWHIGSRMAREGRGSALTVSARSIAARTLLAGAPALCIAWIYSLTSTVVAGLIVRPVADVGLHHGLYSAGLVATSCAFTLSGTWVGLRFSRESSGFIATALVFVAGFAVEVALRLSRWSTFATTPAEASSGHLPPLGPTSARILLAVGLCGVAVAMIASRVVPRMHRRSVVVRLAAAPAVVVAIGVVAGVVTDRGLVPRPVTYVCDGDAPRVCVDRSHDRQLRESAELLRAVARRSGSVLVDPAATIREDLHRSERGLQLRGTASRYGSGALDATVAAVLGYLSGRLDEASCDPSRNWNGLDRSQRVLQFVALGAEPDEVAAHPALRQLASIPDSAVRTWVEAHREALLHCRLDDDDLVP